MGIHVCSREDENVKKKKKSKEAKLLILFLSFVSLLSWSLTNFLAFVVLCKDSGLLFVVLLKTHVNFSP
jgi:hypothetical protein